MNERLIYHSASQYPPANRRQIKNLTFIAHALANVKEQPVSYK